MAFQRYTIEPTPDARGFRIVGHWGLTRVLLQAVTSLREATRRQPEAELVVSSADPFAKALSRSKLFGKQQRWI